MNKALLYLLKAFLLLPVLFLLLVNAKAYYNPPCKVKANGTWNNATVAQLRHLGKQLKDGAAAEMQVIYPEGAIFTYAIYGLAWADLLSLSSRVQEHYPVGLEALDETMEFLLSEEARQPFPAKLPLAYGAFYQGWTSYLLGRKIQLHSPIDYDSTAVQIFREKCQLIATAFKGSERPYLSSYSNGTWPTDNILCLAALSLHDQLFPPIYQSTINSWLTKIKAHLDPQTGLIPHEYIGNKTGGPRGSSQSLMLNFLPLIDSSFAMAQFKLYQKHFLSYRFGLPGVREYPKDKRGLGDIDSGPVVLGIGGAASVVGARAMLINGDCRKHIAIRNSIEGFGVPIKWSGRKKYLGGQLAVADAFITWANARSCECNSTKPTIPWSFHLYSLLLIFSLSWLAYKL